MHPKKTFLRKIFTGGFFLLLLFPLVSLAEVVPLAPIPNLTGEGTSTLPGYINNIFQVLIGVGAIAAVLQIIRGGFQYMTSEAVTNTKDARNTITLAIGGLILLLASYLILFVINPDLVEFKALDFGKPLSGIGTSPLSVGGSSLFGTKYSFEGRVTSETFTNSGNAKDFVTQCNNDPLPRLGQFTKKSDSEFLAICTEPYVYTVSGPRANTIYLPVNQVSYSVVDAEVSNYNEYAALCNAAKGTMCAQCAESPNLTFNPPCLKAKYICSTDTSCR